MAPEEDQTAREGSHGTKRCPFCAEEILLAAKKCKHCGSILDEDLELTEGYLPPSPQVVSGQTLNERYIISGRIARGGMAEIFKARDLELDMDVALKIVPPALADDPRQIGYLRGEAKITIQLTHQNVVRIYGFDASSDTKFIVMEYVSGRNLYQLARGTSGGTFEISQVIVWLEPVCDALDYAHSLGVIHRDIKPSNIMVNDEGVVKVADFGIARRIRDSMKAISQQTVRGTPSYMSPEQLRGEKLTVQSDIYSLGATVYMLLAGSAPFASAAVAASHHRPPPDAIPGIPPRLFRVLKKSLETGPYKRYATAGEFFLAVKDAVERPLSRRHEALPAAEATPTPVEIEKAPREVPIRVETEELPEGLDAESVTLQEKAAKAAAEGDIQKALITYEKLRSLMPGSADVYCRIGECHAKAGELSRAVTAFQHAIRIDPDNPYAWYQLGLTQEQTDQPDAATKSYKRAVEIKQAHPDSGPQVTLPKLKAQIQNVKWKLRQTDKDRRTRLRKTREFKKNQERDAAERRQKTTREIIIILFVLLAVLIALGIAQFLFDIFRYLPF